MRAWIIDLAVWLGAMVCLIVAVVFVVAATSPPDQATLAKQAQTEWAIRYAKNMKAYEGRCMSNPDMTAYVPDGLEDKYCQCLAFYTVGGTHPLAQGRPLKCLREVARDLAQQPDIEGRYASVFPASCVELEQQLTGKIPNPGSDFCGCIQQRIGGDRTRMAIYAVAGSENADDYPLRSDIAFCRSTGSVPGSQEPSVQPQMPPASQLEWVRVDFDGGSVEAVINFPFDQPFANVRIQCFAKKLEFTPFVPGGDGGVFGPFSLAVGNNKLAVPGNRGDQQAADAIKWLVDVAKTHRSFHLTGRGASMDIPTTGFVAIAPDILRACHAPS
jgi:hypothetical protein